MEKRKACNLMYLEPHPGVLRRTIVSRPFRLTSVVLAFLFVTVRLVGAQQQPEIKFVQDTMVVQAEGSYESDPDLATLTFDISSQDKDMKHAYDAAAQSMQKIVDLAQKSGLKKEDVSTGVLTLVPSYERDKKNRAKSYAVQGILTVKVHDFSLIGPLLDGAVQEGIVDFRSLTYSLQDEEGAREKAVAAAMHNAVGRATAALSQNGQKVGAIRYANLDVRQLAGVVRLGSAMETVEVQSSAVGAASQRERTTTFPSVTPQKITVSATVQCAFQIQ
jgi:uncharacterized protein